MESDQQAQQPTHAVPMSVRDLLSIFSIGAVTGLIVWGLGLILSRYAFDTIFCQGIVLDQCQNTARYSDVVATVAGGVFGLVGLIRARVYRPLLIVLAAGISLWGAAQLAWNTNWYWGILLTVIMYALAYGFFSWIARIRVFGIALAVTIVAVIAVRLALMA